MNVTTIIEIVATLAHNPPASSFLFSATLAWRVILLIRCQRFVATPAHNPPASGFLFSATLAWRVILLIRCQRFVAQYIGRIIRQQVVIFL
ncbi:MAG: hypothetical protein ACPGWR_10000 [Ardenticatenaceae bacterium]